MKFFLNDKQRLLGEAAIERAENRVYAAFSKYGDSVKSIEITVQDVNGPRGGVDKVCRVLVRLRRRKDIVVTVNDASVSKIIPAAIERAARSVGRQVNRREYRIQPTGRLALKA
ncbi:hypothetical protein [Mariniblastus fucicola]|uniref:Sigma 54 modulation protein / S30EA ribosomal protein n=1 Tax=Mariniblastus fucicola TaxID=980251 RepID=A0A5B9PJ28_9BACT|nr:hypothetical protein [Mariniblastus fucicola]QEG24682.1 hypothetical protein MFFC18_46030 [Mariniblastus fucicola]